MLVLAAGVPYFPQHFLWIPGPWPSARPGTEHNRAGVAASFGQPAGMKEGRSAAHSP